MTTFVAVVGFVCAILYVVLGSILNELGRRDRAKNFIDEFEAQQKRKRECQLDFKQACVSPYTRAPREKELPKTAYPDPRDISAPTPRKDTPIKLRDAIDPFASYTQQDSDEEAHKTTWMGSGMLDNLADSIRVDDLCFLRYNGDIHYVDDDGCMCDEPAFTCKDFHHYNLP